MDFLEIVENNKFLKKIFPSGFPEELGLIELTLGPHNKSGFCVRVMKKSGSEVKKWGEWGADYDVLFFYFYGEIRGARIRKFDNFRECSLGLSNEDELRIIIFKGKDVDVELDFESLWVHSPPLAAIPGHGSDGTVKRSGEYPAACRGEVYFYEKCQPAIYNRSPE